MQPHSRLGRGRRRAATEALDPGVVASEVVANAQPYENFYGDAVLPSVYCPPLLDQPFTGCLWSVGPPDQIWSNIDALGRLIGPFPRCLAEDVAPPAPGVQLSRTGSSTSASSRGYVWLEHGQKDPAVQSKRAPGKEDNRRIDAMKKKGGACGPCRYFRKQCDDDDHCHGCIHRRLPSEAKFLAFLGLVSYYTPDLENVSLYQLESAALGSSANLDAAAVVGAQAQATHHVNSWFKNVTRMIDPKPFYDGLFEPQVSLEIISGFKEVSSTCFNLDFLDIYNHLESTAYQLDEESLLADFVAHGSVTVPPTPRNGRSRSQCVNHMSWAVSNAFAFLRSFANADIYASINNMSAARASISILYAGLYRLLLAKSDDLCSFILESLRQNFHYCTRQSREVLIEDSLKGIAQYYHVLTGLADLELESSPEVAALFSDLKDHAKTLLRNGGVERLFLRLAELTRPLPAPSLHATFKELISSRPSEVPEIKPLSIGLRVNSGAHHLRPVSTEIWRDTDPYHHYMPIKVRDLLKETEDLVMDPRQLYVDGFVGNFSALGRAASNEAGPSVGRPSSFVGPEVLSDSRRPMTEAPSTSVNPEHASMRPSQQDTDIRSIESESTVQNDCDIDQTQPVDSLSKEGPTDQDWQDVPRGKRRKRHQRSGDSQHSRQASGHGQRKFIKVDSDRRDSPPPCNYFGPLTLEPATLP